VHLALSKNPSILPAGVLTVTQFGADVDALGAAQATTLMRTPVAYPKRDALLFRVVSNLDFALACVQWLVDAEGDPDAARAIAENVGMTTVGRRVTGKNALTAKKSKKVVHGVDVFARKTYARESFKWGYSIDGGRTWIDAMTTTQARTTLGPFTPGMTLLIRSRSVGKTGLSNWSDPITFIVT
jgi:hypothetical protein